MNHEFSALRLPNSNIFRHVRPEHLSGLHLKQSSCWYFPGSHMYNVLLPWPNPLTRFLWPARSLSLQSPYPTILIMCKQAVLSSCKVNAYLPAVRFSLSQTLKPSQSANTILKTWTWTPNAVKAFALTTYHILQTLVVMCQPLLESLWVYVGCSSSLSDMLG